MSVGDSRLMHLLQFGGESGPSARGDSVIKQRMHHSQQLSASAYCTAIWLTCSQFAQAAVTPNATPVETAKPAAPSKASVSRASPRSAAIGSAEPVVISLTQRVIGLQKALLANGLRVVMDVEPESPTVAVCITYDVGSRNESPGQSGFAHLFEHMMFQGSRHVPKGSHFQMVSSRGGTLNGTTSTDRTNYFETMPSNELQLALWLEADRMHWLNVSQDNLDNQRAVVKEEYRMRYENAPYRLAQIDLDRHIYAGYPPYAHPTIGNLEDLDRARIDWVKDFHAQYYVPSNAVLSIVGGFEPDQAMGWVHEYFDPIANRPARAFQQPATPPPQAAEVRLEITDKNAKTPALFFGWRIMPHKEDGHAALELLTRLLADGESSILYERLVREMALARSVSAYTYDRSGPDGLVLNIELTQEAKFEQVESVVRDTLNSLARNGPETGQLNRALQRSKSSFIFDLQSNQSRAITFGEYEVVFGDARSLVNDLQRLLAVTPDHVRRAMSQYLTPATQTIIRVIPADVTANNPAAGTRP